jgi:hypothetical protein
VVPFARTWSERTELREVTRNKTARGLEKFAPPPLRHAEKGKTGKLDCRETVAELFGCGGAGRVGAT